MSVANITTSSSYIAQGLRPESFPVTFDFPDIEGVGLEVLVNDEILDPNRYNVNRDAQTGVVSVVTVAVGSAETPVTPRDSRIIIRRITDLRQDVGYIQGSDISASDTVDALDKLTLIVQENKSRSTDDPNGGSAIGDLNQTIVYGATGISAAPSLDEAVIGPLVDASNVFNSKVIPNVKLSGFLADFTAPKDDGYYYIWVAVPDSLEGILYFGEDSANWIRYNVKNLVAGTSLNPRPFRVYYRRVPLQENQRKRIVVGVYE